MSRICYVCGKKPVTGMAVSHSMQHTKRKWMPNLQKISILVRGRKKREYVCAKCLKAGKVSKAA
jgi:large subunit ribosomal protein L28